MKAMEIMSMCYVMKLLNLKVMENSTKDLSMFTNQFPSLFLQKEIYK